MQSVREAQQILLQQIQPLAPEIAPLSSSSLGWVLAEDVISDIDMPPFDKSMMDGYAMRAEDLANGKGTFTLAEEVMAGQTPSKSVMTGQVTRIMTGAPIPDGADAVVMIERTSVVEGKVQIEDQPPKPGQHILKRGREMKVGDVVLTKGSRLRPQEFGLMAAVGKTAAQMIPAPRVSILSTGDEIIEPFMKPGPGQIRNSNGPMLSAQVSRAGGVPRFLGIAQDSEESLRSYLKEALEADIVILSGGVSAGQKDLVPAVLQELKVQAHFHKVKMKPGKPVFFGTRGTTAVFGLPGNPVSSLVCFELFVRPAIRKMMNQASHLPTFRKLPLTDPFSYRSDRPTYYPARISSDEGLEKVTLLPWFGSADLRGLSRANGFAHIEPGDHQFSAGTILAVMSVDGE